ncbi:MAG: hypothetical protein P4L83_25280 [Nevskia sp.]|nr:hypothetical protein [Nevskia sp.]
MNHKLAAAVCAASAAICLAPAYAYDFGSVRINGFGQVVTGSTLDNNRKFETNSNPTYSYDADPKFDEESLFALQVTAPLTNKLTATAQIVSHGNDNFKTEFEWAYLNYQFNSDWSVKLGRQRDPLFYYSDYLEVGVAYPWLRVPTAVYGSVGGFSNIDGISVNYSHSFGKWEFDPQFIYGRYTGPLQLGPDNTATANLDDRNQVGFSMHAGYNDWLNLRAGYFVSQLSITNTPVDPLINTLQQVGLKQAANDLAANGDTITFMELGTEINYAKWEFISEYVELKSYHNYIAHSHDFYVGLGRHFGRFMPMFTYGRVNASSPATDETNDLASGTVPAGALGPGTPPVPVPGTVVFGSTVSGLLASQTSHDNFYQFDLRYDLANNVALKVDYTGFNSSVPGRNSSNLVSAGVAFSF